MRVLLDADVLIGALDRTDSHHGAARQFFTRWRADGDDRQISVVNLAEVLVLPASGAGSLQTAREAITALGIKPVGINEAVAVDAARYRARHPISLADAFCLATARQHASTLFSFDQRLLGAARAEQIRTG